MTGPARGLALRLRDVTRVYAADEDVVALDRADLEVEAGASVALVGPSGSGKSTVLTLLAGLQRPDHGEVLVGEHPMHALTQRRLHALRADVLGVLLQVPGAALLPWASAHENVAVVAPSGQDAKQLLDRLGLATAGGTPVARLSGGEQQRVALAVALASRPAVLLLDEPTSQLDPASRAAVLDLLTEASTSATLLIATHDDEVAGLAEAVVRVRDGRLIA